MTLQPRALSAAEAMVLCREIEVVLDNLVEAGSMPGSARRRELLFIVRRWADRGLDREWPMHAPAAPAAVTLHDGENEFEVRAMGTDVSDIEEEGKDDE